MRWHKHVESKREARSRRRRRKRGREGRRWGCCSIETRWGCQLAHSLPSVPSIRISIGQHDLTSTCFSTKGKEIPNISTSPKNTFPPCSLAVCCLAEERRHVQLTEAASPHLCQCLSNHNRVPNSQRFSPSSHNCQARQKP